jgi:hypothetical protein
MESFATATATRPSAPGVYTGHLRRAFSFADVPNGGYLLAVMLRAAAEDSPHAHPVIASAEFLQAAHEGSVQILTDAVRVSRSLSSHRVRLRQRDRFVAEGLVTVAELDAGEPPRWSTAPPPIPRVEHCLPARPSRDEGLARHLDLRFDPSTEGWREGRPTGVPELRAHLRLRPPTDPDPFVLALAADALPPVIVNLGLRGWAPTVRLTWQLRALPAAGWLAVHAAARSVSQRWFDEDVEIWDATGRLVAQSRQMALIGSRHASRA